jgi:uncharacterized membrane protein YeaQ/YmgE (transglycosylase-associated protein family)
VSILIWIVIGLAVGFAAARTRPGWDGRGMRGFAIAGVAGALAGGLLAWAAGLGSIDELEPQTWLAASVFAVIAVSVYQSTR